MSNFATMFLVAVGGAAVVLGGSYAIATSNYNEQLDASNARAAVAEEEREARLTAISEATGVTFGGEPEADMAMAEGENTEATEDVAAADATEDTGAEGVEMAEADATEEADAEVTEEMAGADAAEETDGEAAEATEESDAEATEEVAEADAAEEADAEATEEIAEADAAEETDAEATEEMAEAATADEADAEATEEMAEANAAEETDAGATEEVAEAETGDETDAGATEEMAEADATEADDTAGEELTEASAETDAPAVAVVDAALVEEGEKVFRRCKACHQIGEGAESKTGPHLNNLMGRVMGSVEDFSYSDVFQEANAAGRVIDTAWLTDYLAKPRETMPGTKMAFAGLRKDADIEAVIAYLTVEGDI